MNDLLKIFDTDDNEQGNLSRAAGSIGVWLLHLCKITFLGICLDL